MHFVALPLLVSACSRPPGSDTVAALDPPAPSRYRIGAELPDGQWSPVLDAAPSGLLQAVAVPPPVGEAECAPFVYDEWRIGLRGDDANWCIVLDAPNLPVPFESGTTVDFGYSQQEVGPLAFADHLELHDEDGALYAWVGRAPTVEALVAAPVVIELGPEVGRVTSPCGVQSQHDLIVDGASLPWGETRRIGDFDVVHSGVLLEVESNEACDWTPDRANVAVFGPAADR